MVSIYGLSTCLPSFSFTQPATSQFAAARAGLRDQQHGALERLYRLTRIKSRASVFADGSDSLETFTTFFPIKEGVTELGPSTAERMAAYNKFAAQLSSQACTEALALADSSPRSITHLVTVSCTGFGAPGFDLNLVKQLRLAPTVYRTHVGFMGCHGAMNGLRVAQGFLAQNPNAQVLLCATEICSLHFQYGNDKQDIVANSLFADGSAALVLRNDSVATAEQKRGLGQLSYIDSFSCVVPDSEDAMSWTIGDHGFKMTLSSQVPHLIETHLALSIDQWLATHSLKRSDIASWAVHPGGPRVLDSVTSSLNLDQTALAVSRQVLEECGNMSSPTILFILQRILQTSAAPPEGAPIVALAFGPGLTVEAALFSKML